MSIAKNTTFTIRLTGEGVRPSLLAASDLAALLIAAEQTVSAIIQRNHPELEDSVIVGLSEIKDESIGFVFTSNRPDYARSSYNELVSAVNERQFRSLPGRSLDGLRTLTRFTRERRGHTQFWNGGTRPLLDLPPDYPIEVPQPDYVRGETILYGKVERVGGVRPRVRLRVSDREIVSADITEEQGRELGQLLYHETGLRGHATWEVLDGSVAYFRVIEVIHHTPASTTAAFQELAGLVGGVFDEIEDIDRFADRVREGDAP